jgi:unsaturated rhamnogalacturonyl hydrolase
VPRGDAYWLRGNGWAVASLAAILEALPEGHADRGELRAILERTARALAPLQRPSGFWSTVVNRRTYAESSGTLLLAYGFAKAARRGDLGAEYRAIAERAFEAVASSLEDRERGPSLPGISAATMPYPFVGYTVIPRRSDLPYGVAALLFAAMELGPESSARPNG